MLSIIQNVVTMPCIFQVKRMRDEEKKILTFSYTPSSIWFYLSGLTHNHHSKFWKQIMMEWKVKVCSHPRSWFRTAKTHRYNENFFIKIFYSSVFGSLFFGSAVLQLKWNLVNFVWKWTTNEVRSNAKIVWIFFL